jgi:hypothetical protein
MIYVLRQWTAVGLLGQIEKQWLRVLHTIWKWNGVTQRLGWAVTWQPWCRKKERKKERKKPTNKQTNTLTNTLFLPAEGNFYNECGKTLKPAVVPDHKKHTRKVDESDSMTNCSLLADYLWNGQRIYISTLWNLPLSTLIMLTSCGSKLSH